MAAPEGLLEDFYQEVNLRRQDRGLSTLSEDPGLEFMANIYSKLCAENKKTEHNLLPPEVFTAVYISSGAEEYVFIGEILQSGNFYLMDSGEKLVTNFFESELHKSYILDPVYSTVGAGYHTFEGRFYFVAYFGERPYQ